MAFSFALRHSRLALAAFYILISLGKFGKSQGTPSETAAAGVLANEYLPGQVGANQGYPQAGNVDKDPDHVVNEALLCFDEKQIYSSCSEAYRLSSSGDLNVPAEYTDQYCNGPCVSETHLVLNCIEGVLLQFKFYNQATISDVRETIKSGCSYGSKRGDFNVAERIQEEHSNGHRTNFSLFLSGLVLIIMTRRLML
nr:uncharacterized protein LOC113733901 [Coffea arabica]